MDKAPSRYKNGQVERRGDVWYFRYREGDARPRVRIGSVKDFPTKTAATRACAGIRERINSHERFVGPKTMSDVIARYLMEELPGRPSTAKNYRHYLARHIEPRWGAVELTKIRAHDIRAWIRSVDLGDKSRGHIHGLMRILFRFAMLWEWYPANVNPLQLFKMEHSTRRAKEPRILTPDEFRRLQAELPEPYRAMVTVCASLGLRCSELVALQWQDIDWHASELTVRRAAVGRHLGDVKTQRSAKSMPVAPELLSVFTALRREATGAGPSEWIFPSSQHDGMKPWNAYALQRYRVTPAAVRAGLGANVGWHALRHSYRAWLDRLGAPIGVQRDLMRHADIRTTMNVYGGTFSDEMKDAQDGVARMILQ